MSQSRGGKLTYRERKVRQILIALEGGEELLLLNFKKSREKKGYSRVDLIDKESSVREGLPAGRKG